MQLSSWKHGLAIIHQDVPIIKLFSKLKLVETVPPREGYLLLEPYFANKFFLLANLWVRFELTTKTAWATRDF